jgi:hypothetical protein
LFLNFFQQAKAPAKASAKPAASAKAPAKKQTTLNGGTAAKKDKENVTVDDGEDPMAVFESIDNRPAYTTVL